MEELEDVYRLRYELAGADETIKALRGELEEVNEKLEELIKSVSTCTSKLPDGVAFDIANDDIRYQIVCNLVDRNNEHRNTIKQLKQQLKEKDKENNELVFIIEEMEQFVWEQLNNENFDKYKAYDEMFTKIKQLTKHSPYEKTRQDKISFTIEQLEKVKNRIESKVASIYKKLDELNVEIVCESTSRQLDAYEEISKEIDNQIKQLKGKVEDVKD